MGSAYIVQVVEGRDEGTINKHSGREEKPECLHTRRRSAICQLAPHKASHPENFVSQLSVSLFVFFLSRVIYSSFLCHFLNKAGVIINRRGLRLN